MARLLITGASGFVGRSLVPVVTQLGHDVSCVVRNAVAELDARQIVVESLESISDWDTFLDEVDIIIHLAAKVHVMNNKIALEEFCKINTDATLHFAESAAKKGVKRFIFISSIKVNGESTKEGIPFVEEVEQVPEDAYAKSKFLAEQGLLDLAKTTKMDVVILRPSLVFGPGVKANFLKIMGIVKSGWPLPFKNINNKRHFIFIDNLISAIVAVLEHPKAANQIYLVADNECWSLSELLLCLGDVMDKPTRLFTVPGFEKLFNCLGLNALSRRLLSSLEVSNNKIKKELGWTPPISSREGMAQTVKWYLNEYNK